MVIEHDAACGNGDKALVLAALIGICRCREESSRGVGAVGCEGPGNGTGGCLTDWIP